MRWLDLAWVTFLPRPRCFGGGWGDPDILESALDGSWAAIDPAPVTVRFDRERVDRDVRALDGRLAHPSDDLPLEARHGRVRLLLPRRGPVRGLAVALASWGDDSYKTRTRIFGPAAARGVGVLMLENALYGTRRRAGQEGTRLSFVSDFVTMGRATIAEAIGLMDWAQAEGYPKIGVCGFSMGGQMAAMAGALRPAPTRIVSLAPSLSPANVFVEGPLSRDVDWARLGPDARRRLYPILSPIRGTLATSVAYRCR